MKNIKDGVPQNTVLKPVLFIPCTNDMTKTLISTTETFGGDTAPVARGDPGIEARIKQQ